MRTKQLLRQTTVNSWNNWRNSWRSSVEMWQVGTPLRRRVKLVPAVHDRRKFIPTLVGKPSAVGFNGSLVCRRRQRAQLQLLQPVSFMSLTAHLVGPPTENLTRATDDVWPMHPVGCKTRAVVSFSAALWLVCYVCGRLSVTYLTSFWQNISNYSAKAGGVMFSFVLSSCLWAR